MSPAAAGEAALLLLGPEEGEKSAFIEKFRETLASRHGEQPEVTRFYGGESRAADVVLCLRNKTLFAGRRLVIYTGVEQLKRAEEVRAIVEYLTSPSQDATLLLVTSGFAAEVDRRIVGAVPKDRQKIFWEMFDNQKQGWIVSYFRQRKITIEPAAVDCILDMVENNTRDMRAECERLALFFGQGAAISLADAERYIYHSKEENVFTLFDRLCDRELAAAEDVLEKILLSREAESTQIASGLLVQFRRLASLKRLQGQNYESSEAFTRLRILGKRNQRTYLEGAKKFSAGDLENIRLLLAAFDERLRTIRSDLHALLLHLLVYYIVQRAGQGAWRQSL
ncbi:MAG TPA: DNA polymerase III subunit delta [Spirochaetia bacterium]|nr:DNA polymerase III subunit delta [Spirochaetia bacterium]